MWDNLRVVPVKFSFFAVSSSFYRMKLNYQQRSILYGVGLVVLIFLWFFGFYNVQSRKIAEMKLEIVKVNDVLNRAKSSSKGLKKLQDDIKNIRKDIEEIKEKIPSTDKLLYISDVIQRNGEKYGLQFHKIIPQQDILFSGQSERSPIVKIPINIWMAGKYFDLGRFIESFDNFPFLLKAGSVKISADDDNYPEMDIYLVAYTYLYR